MKLISAVGRRPGRFTNSSTAGADSSDLSSAFPECLQQLTKWLQFPEEVAAQLTESEHLLFSRVPPVDYIRQVTSDLTKQPPQTVTSAESRGGQQTKPTVNDLVVRFQQVCFCRVCVVKLLSQDPNQARLGSGLQLFE